MPTYFKHNINLTSDYEPILYKYTWLFNSNYINVFISISNLIMKFFMFTATLNI